MLHTVKPGEIILKQKAEKVLEFPLFSTRILTSSFTEHVEVRAETLSIPKHTLRVRLVV